MVQFNGVDAQSGEISGSFIRNQVNIMLYKKSHL